MYTKLQQEEKETWETLDIWRSLEYIRSPKTTIKKIVRNYELDLSALYQVLVFCSSDRVNIFLCFVKRRGISSPAERISASQISCFFAISCINIITKSILMQRMNIIISYLKNHNPSFITNLYGYELAKINNTVNVRDFFDSYLSLRTLLIFSELPLFFKPRFYIFSLFNELWCLFSPLLRCFGTFQT